MVQWGGGEKRKFFMKSFSFEGLFVYKDFFRVLDVWLRDKFYDKFEKRNEEFVRPDGTKNVDVELTPWKKTTDYFKLSMKVEVLVSNMRDVEIEQNGKKVRLQKGKLDVKIGGYVTSDYEGRWDEGAWYFIREVFDQFVYRRISKKYYDMAIDDVTDLHNTLTSYLNIYQYKMA
jgi:hypothetical protein